MRQVITKQITKAQAELSAIVDSARDGAITIISVRGEPKAAIIGWDEFKSVYSVQATKQRGIA